MQNIRQYKKHTHKKKQLLNDGKALPHLVLKNTPIYLPRYKKEIREIFQERENEKKNPVNTAIILDEEEKKSCLPGFLFKRNWRS